MNSTALQCEPYFWTKKWINWLIICMPMSFPIINLRVQVKSLKLKYYLIHLKL